VAISTPALTPRLARFLVLLLPRPRPRFANANAPRERLVLRPTPRRDWSRSRCMGWTSTM